MSEEKQERTPSGQFAAKGIGIDLTKFNLSNVQDCFRLLDEIAKGVLEGRIGSRAAGSANNSIRIILSYHSDIQKAALNQAAIEESKRRIKELEDKLAEKGEPE